VWDAIGDLPEVEDIDALLKSDVYVGPLGRPSAYAARLRTSSNGAPGRTFKLSGCQRTVHKPAVRRRFDRTSQGALEQRSRSYRLSADGVSFTLRAGTGPESPGHFTAARHIHPESPRYITVRESARLHSYPDGFQFSTAKWHALRQIGNSVPPLLAAAVAREILRAWKADRARRKRRRSQ
jgi:DNA (cytosine-5)-methyltransferase 1